MLAGTAALEAPSLPEEQGAPLLLAQSSAASHPSVALLDTGPVSLRTYQRGNALSILKAVAPGALPRGRPGAATFAGSDSGAGRCGVAAFRAPARLLYVLPTGGGKTVVIAAVLHAIVASGGRCLVLVHRKELVEQTVAQLSRRGVECGVIMAGYRPRRHAPVQVASVATLAKRAEQEFGQFQLVVVDEAHHTVADTYLRALRRWPRAALLGATATPFRLDGQGLFPHFTQLLAGPNVRALIDAGFLVEPVIMSDASSVDTRGLPLDAAGVDFAPGALARRAGSITGDVVRQFAQSGGTRRAIVYAVNVEHCNSIAESFCDAGFTAEAVHSGLNANARQAVMARVRSGETQIMVNVAIAIEGLDVPEFEAVVMVRPTLSQSLYRQMIGRGLRPSPGKADCLVLDHAGNVALHGLPTDDFPLSLYGIPKREHPAVKEEKKASSDDDDDEADDDEPKGWQPRFGDPGAELQRLRTCTLVNADTNEELLSARMVRRRGFRFAREEYDVLIHEPSSKAGGQHRAECGDRAVFLKPPPWGPAWCAALGELVAEPSHARVVAHTNSLLFLMRKPGSKLSAPWAARRLVEQWGKAAAARLLQEDEPGAAESGLLHRSREGYKVRYALKLLLRTPEEQAAAEQSRPRVAPPPRRPPLWTQPAQLYRLAAHYSD